MAVPKTTLWKRSPHTEGKHLVLEHYLNAWFPILGMGDKNARILFVDGFAGPGEYEGGEEGSPVVALRVLAEHSARKRINAEVVFLFIEREPERARHLERLVAQRGPELPQGARVHVLEGSFDSLMTNVLNQLDQQKTRMAPALVMMDPFGIKSIPIGVIRRILGNPMCEVYVTFMWEAINRHIEAPGFEDHLTKLFGTDEWKRCIPLAGRERKFLLHRLYRRQLKAVGASQVVHFHLLKGNRLKYSIFFGTGHTLGSDCMKEAIWKADPTGDYNFRGGEQAQLGFLEPDFAPLQDGLKEQFEHAGWVSIEEIEEFVRSDATIYYAGQVRSRALRPMERAGQIDVDEKSRKKRGFYPKGCRINFRPEKLSLF